MKNCLRWVSIAAFNITTWNGIIFFDEEKESADSIVAEYCGFKDYREYKDSYNAQDDVSQHAIMIDRWHHDVLGRISYSPFINISLIHYGLVRTDSDYFATEARKAVYNEYNIALSRGENVMFMFPLMDDMVTALRYKKVPKDALWYCLDWKG